MHIDGKICPAGTFAVQLLNQYYKDDAVARIAVFRQSNWNVQEQLCAGYLNETDFIKVGEVILTILQTLPKLKPFSSLDIAAERQRIAELFTESKAAAGTPSFRVKGKGERAKDNPLKAAYDRRCSAIR